MKRGALILTLGILLGSLAAAAQPLGKVYRIGSLHNAFAPNVPWVEGLQAGLKDLGLEEGRDVILEHRFTEGDLQGLPAAVAALIKAGVDLIYAGSEPATQAAKAATQALPIVFVNVGDPVASGIVSAIAHPGGNVTGVSNLGTELTGKRIEVLKELVPSLRRVWVIYDAADSGALPVVHKAREAAPLLKLQLMVRPVRTPAELARALEQLGPRDGVMVHDRATSLDIPAQTLKASLRARVPAVFPSAFWIRYGALASYGADYSAVGRQAARLVAKILRGARPQDLPVEGANRIELAINLKTAKRLGIAVPRELLVRAEKVVE